MVQKISSDTVDPPTGFQRIPASTPKTRNRVVLDRDDGRQWTPPPTARELTAADPTAGYGSQTWSRYSDEISSPARRRTAAHGRRKKTVGSAVTEP